MLENITQSEVLRDNTPVILVGNKTDLVRARQITEDEAKAVAVYFCCKYVEVSAALDHNVGTLLVGVVRQIRQTQPEIVEKNLSRRKSKVRGFFNKIIGSHESDKRVSKSFDNLSVI